MTSRYAFALPGQPAVACKIAQALAGVPGLVVRPDLDRDAVEIEGPAPAVAWLQDALRRLP